MHDRFPTTARRVVAGLVLTLALGAGVHALAQDATRAPDPFTGADWIGLLPDGEPKRRYLLDCAGCHGLDVGIARRQGRPRTADVWAADVARMLRYAGATTGFPVIAHDRDSTATAAWLARHLAKAPVRRPSRGARVVEGAATEFDLPVPQDLPHDLAIGTDGRVVITGMFTHQMYVLDPATRAVDTVAIPVPKANPRAVEIDSTGAWWVALGGPKMLARHDPASGAWRTFVTGHYPHSLALGRPGEVWWNGHFTRAPELIGRAVVATGARDTFVVPPHPRLAEVPGGPIPYEIRVGPGGVVWGSELQGNRLFACDPERGTFRSWEMPVTHSGPRRFDVDPDGVLWIPAYAANELVRFDPATATFRRIALPVRDAVPYVARVDRATRRVWIGTAAADVVIAYDPAPGRFTLYPLPSRGALVRHLAIDPRTHDVWAAYGASPGPLPARVARIHPEDGRADR